MSVLPPKPRDHRAKAPSRVQVAEEMFQTLQEMTTQVAFQVSRQASLEALGPFAALFEEFLYRQSVLEDALWYCADCHIAKFFPIPPLTPPLCPFCAAGAEGKGMTQYAFVPPPKKPKEPDAAP